MLRDRLHEGFQKPLDSFQSRVEVTVGRVAAVETFGPI